MKTYLISTLVILGSLYLSPCSAVSILQEYCPHTTILVGTKCNELNGSDAFFITESDCHDPISGAMLDTCKLYLCNGECRCRTSSCGGSIIVGPIEPVDRCNTSCFNSITWSMSIQSAKFSGTVNLPNSTSCSGCPTTVYRCASGTYTTLQTLHPAYLPDGVSNDENLECLPCLAASDDSSLYLADDIPSYTASSDGLPLLSDCYIKANSAISTDVGTYEYTSDCKYTE